MEREGEETNLVYLGQRLDVRPVQHPQRQGDHLQILGPGRGGDVARLGPDVEDDGPLQPGDEEVRALVDDLLLDSRHAVEDDGAGAALDVVDGRLQDAEPDGGRDGGAVDEA